MRPSLRFFLNCLIACGLVMALWPLGQTAYGKWNQKALAAQFQEGAQSRSQAKKPLGKPQSKPGAVGKSSPAMSAMAASKTRAKRAPWPLTKLSIPDIGLETYIVQGVDAPALKRGPGHDVNSSLPGQGNCVVAGHRNVYGSFFYRLDELLPGSPIRLENRDGKWEYTVDAVYSTPATNLSILQPPPTGAAPLLTLISCTLPHTNNRIILQARLNPT